MRQRRSAFLGFALALTFLFWQNLSQAFAQIAPGAGVYATRYDIGGRVVGTIQPDPDGSGPLGYPAIRTVYDLSGSIIRVETGELGTWQDSSIHPNDWAGFRVLRTQAHTYDAIGRKVQDTLSAAGSVYAVTNYSYSADNRLECTAVRMNPEAWSSLPASACTLGPEGAFGPDRITRQDYSPQGWIIKIQKAVGTPLQQDYARYTFSISGKQTSLIDANGNLATMAYDGFDRLARWTFPSPTSTGSVNSNDYEEYAYDAAGNRITLRKRDGSTISYQYDALNRNVVKVVPERGDLDPIHTRDVYYGYDNRGLQTYARFDSPTGEGVTTTYDGFGRVVATTIVQAGLNKTLNYGYDSDGKRLYITHPDGQRFNYRYDALGRMSQLQQADGTSLLTLYFNSSGERVRADRRASSTLYTFDALGRLVAQNDNFAGGVGNIARSLAYNPQSQIVAGTLSNEAYSYKGALNVVRPYAVNGLNQYTQAGPAQFSYDANGNLTGDGTNSYRYDIENRLVAGPNGVRLVYDPLGRLFSVGGGAFAATQFHYDGDELVGEYAGSGTLLRRFVHGPGADDPVVWYEGAGLNAPRFLHADHQGSITAITDAAGAVVEINRYDAYGIPALTNSGRFQYTGQAWLAELGLYYYKARFYSPTLGRFLQVDPIGYDDQVNLYAYVGNDPLNMTDPEGTDGACLYSPGVCGSKPLTPQQQEARDQTAASVGSAALTVASALPAGRALGALGRLLGLGKAAGKVEKTYQTYTKTNTKTGEVYSGRTSGKGTPRDNVARRDQNHHKNKDGFGPAKLDKTSSDPLAIRGREQQMIERNGGAQSQGGTSGNAINGISNENPIRNTCIGRASREFGPC